MSKKSIFGLALLAISVTVILSSCQDKRSRGLEFSPNMYEPLAYNPDQKNKNFENGITAQVPPAGTTPIGYTRFDEFPNTAEGYEAAGVGITNPLAVNKQNLEEGKQLYLVMCGPCHGPKGAGDGHIVELGKYPAPPSYTTGNSSRGGTMKELSDGKIYHTIQYGLNLMGSYASQLSPDERWKVVMYVKELQQAK